jgi:hypothetical protein
MSYKFNVTDTSATYVAGFRGASSTYIVVGDTSLAGEQGVNFRSTSGQAFIALGGTVLGISATSGANTITLSTGGTERMRLTAAGRLLLGTTTESTFLLDVNGTARVSDNLTVSKNQNAVTELLISNTTSGTGAYPSVRLLSDASSGSCVIGKNSTTFTTYKINSPKDLIIYNNPTGGDIAILNDFSTGNIKLAAGGSSTAHMTLASNGNLLVGTTTDNGEKFQVNGTARVSDNLTVSKNQNAGTIITISNTTGGSNSQSGLVITTNNGNGYLAKYSSAKTLYKIINPSDLYFLNEFSGDISILNDLSTGNIKFAAGGSSTAHMTIKSNGRINMSSLPTSSAGLSSGDLWNDAGTLKIV